MSEDRVRALAQQLWDAVYKIADPSTIDEVPIEKQVDTLQLIACEALSSYPSPVPQVMGIEWPVGEAEVVMYDPRADLMPRREPHKIIDASLWFMGKAEIGERLYTKEQVEEVVRNAVAAEHERCNKIVRAAWGENISLEKMEAATTWHDIETVPTDERLILIGSYNGRDQWCSEVWSTRYLRDQFAKSADGFFMNAPHLEWLPTHWAELPAPPALATASEVEG
ncbi:hypothetical protein [Rhizobium mongolense]|uniref:DUF551 domain-containing protein n=1 Tax=Rhizobium mongolense TaxID=57676 RepID=A0A7W6RR13_9HYPH|nr:hypothetical protein [Rhizobium mongolense]MBB4277060.1 hypothetical protein [Rhizobium mongolense]